MKKLAAFILAAMMCTTALTACGGGSGSSGGSESSDNSGSGSKAGSITVNIWDANQQKGIQEIADKWTETSGVKVNVEVVDWDNYWTLLEAGASGGTMPDVFWMHSNTAQMYMENDVLLKLNDYIDKDSSIDMSKYYEGVKNLYTRSDGNIYALPKDHDTIALLYNKAIFDKYSVDYPTDKWTWTDMYEAAKKITEGSNGDDYAKAMNTSNNQDAWNNQNYSYGGHDITQDHKGTTNGSAERKEG
ncbi:MAG: extracellular solute-binding protein, partial [Ruminococcus sp.]|nr:extracellular solute-binding protein [Ruminococcus sp.]